MCDKTSTANESYPQLSDAPNSSLAALIKRAELRKLFRTAGGARDWQTAYTDAGFRTRPEWAIPGDEIIHNSLALLFAKSVEAGSVSFEDPDLAGIPADVQAILFSESAISMSLELGQQESAIDAQQAFDLTALE